MIVYPDKFITTSGAVRKPRKKVPGLVFHTGRVDLTETAQGQKDLEEVVRGIETNLKRKQPRPAGMHYAVTQQGVNRAQENALTLKDRDHAAQCGMIPLHTVPQHDNALFMWGYSTTYPHPSQDRYLTIAEVAVLLTLLQNAIAAEPRPLQSVLAELERLFIIDSTVVNVVDPIYGEGPSVLFKTEPTDAACMQVFLGREGARALYSELGPKFLKTFTPINKPDIGERCPVRTHREPGWYWVTTAVKGRTPFKRQVPLEWYYEKENVDMGMEPYVWLDASQNEVMDTIVTVNEERIHEPGE